jgi:SPP1 gp7 family putative phage head morphogenesis protein
MNVEARIDQYRLLRTISYTYKLDSFTDSALTEILKAVQQAKKETLNKLRNRLAAGKKADWTTNRLISLTDEFRGMTKALEAQINKDFNVISRAVGPRSLKEYNDIFSVDQTIPLFNNVRLSPEQLKAMTEVSLEGALLKDMIGKSFDYHIANAMKRDIQAGLLEGASYRKIVNTFSDNFGGLQNTVISLVRTQVQAINNAAFLEVAQANQEILQPKWEWCAILDNRACIRCMCLDGRTFDWNDPIAIPVHIRCRCLRKSLTKSWKEITGGKIDIPRFEPALRTWVERDGQVGVGGAKIKAFGKIKGTYEDFFNRLSDKRKIKLIGPSRAKLLKSNKIKFKDMITSRGDVRLLKKDRKGLRK